MSKRDVWKEFRNQAKKSWTMAVVYLGALGGILESQLHFLEGVAEEYRVWVWTGVIGLIGVARVKGLAKTAKTTVKKRKEADVPPPESGGEI